MSLSWLLAGGLAWTASEYAIHRFVGHGRKRERPSSLLERLTLPGLAAEFNAEHLAHHATPSYFAPTSRKILAAAVGIPTVAAALAPLVGVRRASSFALGFTAMYGAYEILHRRIHTHPPTGPYGRWARRHHLYHHHKTPRANHGVTSAAWDALFGTKKPLERVRIPRNAVPVWLVDAATGEVRPEHAGDYEVWPARADAAPRAAATSAQAEAVA